MLFSFSLWPRSRIGKELERFWKVSGSLLKMIGKTFLFVWWKGDKEWEALINAVTKKEENLFLIIGSPLLIYAFVSLKTVAHYGNYTIIIDKITHFVNNLLSGTNASVGNLIAEGDTKKIQSKVR